MKFALLVYIDPEQLGALPPGEFDERMRHCLAHADDLRQQGKLFDSQMLGLPAAARSVRARNGRRTVLDGPFAETKEVLAGFNLIEADDIDEAVRIAEQFPWIHTGCLEVRPLDDIEAVRHRVLPQRSAPLPHQAS